MVETRLLPLMECRNTKCEGTDSGEEGSGRVEAICGRLVLLDGMKRKGRGGGKFG